MAGAHDGRAILGEVLAARSFYRRAGLAWLRFGAGRDDGVGKPHSTAGIATRCPSGRGSTRLFWNAWLYRHVGWEASPLSRNEEVAQLRFHPFEHRMRLLEPLSTLGAGQAGVVPFAHDRDEIGRLARVFNAMVAKPATSPTTGPE